MDQLAAILGRNQPDRSTLVQSKAIQKALGFIGGHIGALHQINHSFVLIGFALGAANHNIFQKLQGFVLAKTLIFFIAGIVHNIAVCHALCLMLGEDPCVAVGNLFRFFILKAFAEGDLQHLRCVREVYVDVCIQDSVGHQLRQVGFCHIIVLYLKAFRLPLRQHTFHERIDFCLNFVKGCASSQCLSMSEGCQVFLFVFFGCIVKVHHIGIRCDCHIEHTHVILDLDFINVQGILYIFCCILLGNASSILTQHFITCRSDALCKHVLIVDNVPAICVINNRLHRSAEAFHCCNQQFQHFLDCLCLSCSSFQLGICLLSCIFNGDIEVIQQTFCFCYTCIDVGLHFGQFCKILLCSINAFLDEALCFFQIRKITFCGIHSSIDICLCCIQLGQIAFCFSNGRIQHRLGCIHLSQSIICSCYSFIDLRLCFIQLGNETFGLCNLALSFSYFIKHCQCCVRTSQQVFNICLSTTRCLGTCIGQCVSQSNQIVFIFYLGRNAEHAKDHTHRRKFQGILKLRINCVADHSFCVRQHIFHGLEPSGSIDLRNYNVIFAKLFFVSSQFFIDLSIHLSFRIIEHSRQGSQSGFRSNGRNSDAILIHQVCILTNCILSLSINVFIDLSFDLSRQVL